MSEVHCTAGAISASDCNRPTRGACGHLAIGCLAKSRKQSEPHRRHHDTLRASGKIPILKLAQTQPRLEDTAKMRLVRKSAFGRYVCNGVVSGVQQMSTTTNTIYSALWMRSKNCYLTSPKGNSMDTGLLLPLALFALTLAVSPGGATSLATSSGAQFGFRCSITLMVGISAGLATLAAIAGAGLSGLLMVAPSLQLAMKVIGTAYLLWLAWKIGNSGPPNLLANMTNPLGFAAGVSLLWVNPKAWATWSQVRQRPSPG